MAKMMRDIELFILEGVQKQFSKEWVDEATERYPYFNVPAILYLKQKAESGDAITADDNDLLARVAITMPSRRALYMMLGEGASRFKDFYPEPEDETAETPSTDDALDTFLNTYGNTSAKEVEVLNQIIFNPTPEYAQMLIDEEKRERAQAQKPAAEPQRGRQMEAIDRFIAQSEGKVVPELPVVKEPEETVAAPEEKADDSTLSESLAKIYIKQHKYAQALEIIKGLNLKFPEKSIYFADQMRFLQKLIINDNKFN